MRQVAKTIDLVAAFEASPNPYVILDADFKFAGMNAAYLELTHTSRDDLIDRNLFEVFGRDGYGDTQSLKASLEAVLQSGQPNHLPIIFYPIRLPRANKLDYLSDRYWSATHTPIKNEDGKVTHILQHSQDITEQVQLRRLVADLSPAAVNDDLQNTGADHVFLRAATIQADNLRLANERAQLLDMFMQAPGFVAIFNGPEFRLHMMNVACSELFNHRDVLGHTLDEALPELVAQGYKSAMQEVMATGKPFQARQTPVNFINPGKSRLETRYLDFMFQPLSEGESQITGIFVQGHDVSDAVYANQRQNMMIDELNHRVKNTLATVQSIAMQTARSHQDPASFAETFQSRIMALSHTHDLLTQSLWEGADLPDVIRHEIEAYGANRLTLNGPNVALDPAMAVSLGMIFHELATNAAKYGALIPGSGHVVVNWNLDEQDSLLNLTWSEQDGPAPTPPKRRGFGSRLIERNVRHDLFGRVQTYFTPAGFKAEFSIPMSKEGL